jgi:hypothetical protein
VPGVRLGRCGGAKVSCAVTLPLRSSGGLYVGPCSARRAVFNQLVNRWFGRDAAVRELTRDGEVEWGAWAPVD